MSTSAILFYCFLGLFLFGLILLFFNGIKWMNSDINSNDKPHFLTGIIYGIFAFIGSIGAWISGIVWIVNKLAH
jgi:hypothetical protein